MRDTIRWEIIPNYIITFTNGRTIRFRARCKVAMRKGRKKMVKDLSINDELKNGYRVIAKEKGVAIN